jgi:hypothetical protein
MKTRPSQQNKTNIFSAETILRGLTHPLNRYKYFPLLLLLFYSVLVPADVSQRAKSATAEGPTSLDSIDLFGARNINLYSF